MPSVDRPVQLWTDGAQWVGSRKLGFGWVAVDGSRVAGQAFGPVASDGSGNFGSESWAILDALRWAYAAGYRAAEVWSDFESMATHLARRGRNQRWHAVQLYDWIAAHADMAVCLRKAHGHQPWHCRAHFLARDGAALAP